ncbi:FecR family protein [Chondrinema litorale]|uniref:FecR family protein n=1 Tax=Chondrinema litorale TaxID=2994555 RepID=UPI00254358AE|nr:FecR family protein [Chondrinema litorale]UZR96592.1 FecR family protein [Chondrinema litorale]
MQYKDYNLEDFLGDEFFVNWVINPDEGSTDFWEGWLKQNPDKLVVVTQAKEVIKSTSYKENYIPDESVYFDVLENIYKGKKSKLQQAEQKTKYSFYKYAAAIAFILLVGGIWIVNYSNSIEAKEVVASLEFIKKEVPIGKKLSLKMPDGTSIKLNSQSTITYTNQYNQQKREVFLEGEAFFDVTPNPEKPFIIHTGTVTTTVLGTSFNINAYPDKQLIKVAVAEGKVSVENKQSETGTDLYTENVLYPNEMAIYDLGKQKVVKEKVNIEDEISWKDEIIIFRNAKFDAIVDKLEKWYDVKFEIQEGLEIKGEFSGRFDRSSLETVLEGLSFSSNICYKIDEKIIKIINCKK